MDKALFKKYAKWCEENGKDPLDERNIREFKLSMEREKEKEEAEKAANSQEKNKAELVEKQKEIWDMFCKYCGIKAKYDEEEMFEVLDTQFRNFILAAVALNHIEDCEKVFNKLMK